jgi:hypothetical protein
MFRFRSRLRSLDWILRQQLSRLRRVAVIGIPLNWSNYVLHQLEKEGAPDEVDLGVPSWRVSEVVQSVDVVEKSSEIRIPIPGGEPNVEQLQWPDLRIRELANVSMDVDSGLVFARDRVVGQPGTWNRKSRDAAFISGAYARYQRAKQSSSAKFSAGVTPLGDTSHFYHFLIETLPRALHTRRLFPEVSFLTSQSATGASRELIDLLGINVELLPRSTVVSGPRVILSDPPIRFWPRRTDLEAIRDEVFALQDGVEDLGLPLYVSRANSSRSMENEKYLSEALGRIGVRTVYLEELAFLDQLSLIRQASTLIGAHGAGLANVAWMAPGARLIELSSGDRFEACYRRMAHVLELKYDFVQVPGSATSPFGDVTPSVVERIERLL